MAGLEFDPYAARIRFSFSQKMPIPDWQELTFTFLEELGRACMEEKTEEEIRLIGHIKCLALLSPEGYLRGSKISNSIPAQVDVFNPDNESFATLDFIYNILVYGLCGEDVPQIIQNITLRLQRKWPLKITIFPLEDEEHYHYHL